MSNRACLAYNLGEGTPLQISLGQPTFKGKQGGCACVGRARQVLSRHSPFVEYSPYPEMLFCPTL